MQKMLMVVFMLLFLNGLTAGEAVEKNAIKKINQTFVTHEELNMIVQDLNAMRDKLEVKDMALQKYDDEIYFVKNPPMTFACATHDDYLHSISGQVIPYKNLLYSSTNVESVLDIATGKFTAGHPGSYTATWSLRAMLGYRDTVQLQLFLRKYP